MCVRARARTCVISERERFNLCTKTTASRAASASISAHETTPGHKGSSCDFTSSITSNPLKPRFGGALISVEDPVINTEPSQPCAILMSINY